MIIPKNKKILVVDLDETIVQLQYPWHVWTLAIYNIADKFMPEVNPSDFKDPNLLCNHVIAQIGDKAKKAFDEYTLQFETQYLLGYRVNDLLVDLLANSKAEEHYLWTSNMPETAEKALEFVGLQNRFDKLITRADVKLMKPNAEGFGQIKNDSYQLGDYIMLGNSSADEDAAKAAGIDFVLVKF